MGIIGRMDKKILLVDDNKAMRMTLGLVLQQSGFTVVQADDGRLGYKAALTEKPDLIITDLTMPHLTGTQMIEKLRGEKDYHLPPVMMLTSSESIQALNDALRFQIKDYINKNDTDPIKIAEMAKQRLAPLPAQAA